MAIDLNANYDELDRVVRTEFAAAMANAEYTPKTGRLYEDLDSQDLAEDYNLMLDTFGFRKFKENFPKKTALEKRVTIANEEWVDNLTVRKRELETKHGNKYRLFASMQGRKVGRFIDQRTASLLKSTGGAFTANGFDGVPYFSASHPLYKAGGTYGNLDSGGGGQYWYLFDTSLIRPVIWQWRKRPDVDNFGPDSEYARLNQEVLWNFYLDAGWGMSLWHFGYASNQTLNETNLEAAMQAMKKVPTYEKVEGETQLMGVNPNLLVVGSSNSLTGMKLLKQVALASGETNINLNRLDLLEVTYLP